MAESEIMTSEEVAKLLRVSERTVCEWAQQGQIPSGKIGNVWRFPRAGVEAWLEGKLGNQGSRTVSSRPTSIAKLVRAERTLILDAGGKAEVLNQMLENLGEAREVRDPAELSAAMFRREELMSTGIGMQVAVPHVRLASVTDLVMTVAVNGTDLVDYESLDGFPVRILFMIAARRDQHVQHLKALAAISGLIKQDAYRNRVLQARDSDELYNILVGKGDG